VLWSYYLAALVRPVAFELSRVNGGRSLRQFLSAGDDNLRSFLSTPCDDG
jgi:hypothetical protein